jgi:hypothetical protein
MVNNSEVLLSNKNKELTYDNTVESENHYLRQKKEDTEEEGTHYITSFI